MYTLGKIIGGGLPVGAYGGRREIMQVVSPLGPVYQAGTLSGNPLAVAAGLATLRTLIEENPYDQLDRTAARIESAISARAAQHGIPVTINRVGSMLTAFFTDSPVTDYASAVACDTARFAKFFHEMLDKGIYLPPSQFEAWFVSMAHGEEEVERTEEGAAQAIEEME